jgi:mono/diheme cytochrome c family protein
MAGYEAAGPGAPVGFYRMVFDEYHSLSEATLERAAVPWKVLATAMLDWQHQSDPSLPLTEQAFVELLQRRYGFVVPARVANWPAGQAQPAFRRPIGLVGGTFTRGLPPVRMEVANLGCSTCHTAVLYDAAGNPTRDVWVGLPSASIDLGRYADEAYQALLRAAGRPDETLAHLTQVFPDVSETELATLRLYYLPALRARMTALAGTIGALTPYSNGGPGLTNGVATLQLYLGALDRTRRDPTQVAFVSVPDLGGLRLRTSILWDGLYAPPGWPHHGDPPAGMDAAARAQALGGVVSVVTIGTLGVTPEVAVTNIPRVADAVAWMLRDYQPPPFPGAVDATLAARGAAVYDAACASCHGTYRETPAGLRLASFPNKLIPYDVIETDPVRARAPEGVAAGLLARTALGPHIDARPTGGYVAPPLTSLWATAPYLHNGSVPTLWHLMHPEARPVRFEVGGHRLDFAKMGIDGRLDGAGTYRYPAGYRPWMAPEVYDTRSPGRSSAGHDEPFDDMSEDDKRALLEFLKRV